MSTFIKNSDGTETEVFTKKELEEQVKAAEEKALKTATDAATVAAKKITEEALEKYKQDNPDRSSEVEELNAKLKEAQEKVVDNDDDGQKRRLIAERDKAQKDLKEFMEQTTSRLDAIQGGTKDEIINSLVQDDKDLREKVQFHYDSFKGDATTKAEIQARAANAFQLATGNKPTPEILDGLGGAAGSRGDGSGEKGKHTPTENEKQIGNVLGISEADRAKYGPGGEKAPSSK